MVAKWNYLWHVVWLSGLAWLVAGAQAQSPPTSMAVINGSCKTLIVAGKTKVCGTSVLHTVYTNGRMSFGMMILSEIVEMIGFVGDQVIQSGPGEFRLVVTSVVHTVGGRSAGTPVGGECIFKGDLSKSIARSIRCSTKKGGDYRMAFDSDAASPQMIMGR
jgi:hypothetical protein